MVKPRGNKRDSVRITLTLRRVRVTIARKYMKTAPSTILAQRMRLFCISSLVEIQVLGDVGLCHWGTTHPLTRRHVPEHLNLQ